MLRRAVCFLVHCGRPGADQAAAGCSGESACCGSITGPNAGTSATGPNASQEHTAHAAARAGQPGPRQTAHGTGPSEGRLGRLRDQQSAGNQGTGPGVEPWPPACHTAPHQPVAAVRLGVQCVRPPATAAAPVLRHRAVLVRALGGRQTVPVPLAAEAVDGCWR
uniref:Uncharacterized protein n=1 Tax=Anopheles melas TaxID=34690 RepID=A0A182TIY9_9DIPT